MSQTLFNANQLGPNTAVVRQDFTAIQGQTDFVTTGPSFSGGVLLVYVGGALLKLTDDYTVSGSYTVVLNTPVNAGVLVTIILMVSISAFIPPFVAVPTQTVLTSGSGTYMTPAGARQLQIRMVGGGGGGGAGSVNNGSAGENTAFGTVVGNGGAGGTAGNGTQSQPVGGSPGGTATGGDINIAGGGGGSASGYAGGGGVGGSTPFGGGGRGPTYNVNGLPGSQNSGGGGSGGGGVGPSGGGGGGGGGYAEKIINSPAPSYSYSVGAGGAGGLPGVSAGGAGGEGLILIEEIY